MAERLPERPPAAPAAPRAYFWPTVVIALLAGHVLLLTITVLIATRDRAFATEPDYYNKALHWDDIAAQRRANERLGWRVAFEFGDEVSVIGERALTFVITDAHDAPVENADVTLVAFPHARATERTAAQLLSTGPGRYAATLRFNRKGVWEFRLRATRGDDVFTFEEKRDVYPPGEQRPW